MHFKFDFLCNKYIRFIYVKIVSSDKESLVICSFWVIPRRLSSNCRRFGTHYRFHLRGQVNEVLHSPAYEDGTDNEFRNVGN